MPFRLGTVKPGYSLNSRATTDPALDTWGPKGINMELVYIRTRLGADICEKEFDRLDLWWR